MTGSDSPGRTPRSIAATMSVDLPRIMPDTPCATPTSGDAPPTDRRSTDVTIGVAVAVPEPHATALREARRRYGDPQADVVPTHVTILPPTLVPAARMPDIRAHLTSVAADTAPFDIELRGTDTFRPVSPVVFVPLVRGRQACAALAAAVRTGPLQRDLDFSYHPHVTLAHNVPEAQLDLAAADSRDVHVEFTVGEVVLYRRDPSAWRRCASFPFTAGR